MPVKRSTISNKKKLLRLCEKVSKMRSDIDIESRKKQWFAIKDPSARNSHVLSFLYMNFKEEEIDGIQSYVSKHTRKIVGIIIGVGIGVVGLGVIAYFFYVYLQYPRIYTYGNSIPVYANDSFSSATDRQMDIFGQGFGDQSKKSSSNMLVIDLGANFLKVLPDDFLSYLGLNGSAGFVRKDGIVFSKNEYDRYTALLKEMQGDSTLPRFDTRSRKVIYDLVHSNNSFNNSVLASDYAKNNKRGSSKILSVGVEGVNYIFLRLKTPSGPKNLVISDSGEKKISWHDITENNGQLVTWPGLFWKEALDMKVPDVIFYNTQNGREWLSIELPYNKFNPK